jgi:hypothetical protein
VRDFAPGHREGDEKSEVAHAGVPTRDKATALVQCPAREAIRWREARQGAIRGECDVPRRPCLDCQDPPSPANNPELAGAFQGAVFPIGRDRSIA